MFLFSRPTRIRTQTLGFGDQHSTLKLWTYIKIWSSLIMWLKNFSLKMYNRLKCIIFNHIAYVYLITHHLHLTTLLNVLNAKLLLFLNVFIIFVMIKIVIIIFLFIYVLFVFKLTLQNYLFLFNLKNRSEILFLFLYLLYIIFRKSFFLMIFFHCFYIFI